MKPIDLFTGYRTLAAPLFEQVTYAWEVLPQIGTCIQELIPTLSDDYTEIGEDVWVGKNTTISPFTTIQGPTIIGHDCDIRPGAYIRGNALIGNGVVVGNSTEIKNAILFDGVQVPHFNYVGDAVLGYKAHLGAGVILSNLKAVSSSIDVKTPDGVIPTGLRKFSAILGDYAEVGCNAVLNPGTIIGMKSVVYPLTSVRGVVPPVTIVKQDGTFVTKR